MGGGATKSKKVREGYMIWRVRKWKVKVGQERREDRVTQQPPRIRVTSIRLPQRK